MNIVSKNYRLEIDGLRAIAVIAVIVNHFSNDILPSGYLGVDIFFVISGYVITSSIYLRQSNNFLEFISNFYSKRIRRLIPALILYVLVLSVVICMLRPIVKGVLVNAIASLLGISNVALYFSSKDYFAISNLINPFMHTWSLGVEEQFYFLFPLFTWVTGYAKKISGSIKSLGFIISILSLASLIAFIYYYPINQSAAYFLMPMRFWEIGAGCLLFILYQNEKSFYGSLKNIPASIFLFLIFIVLFLPTSYAVLSNIAIVLLTSFLIFCIKDTSLLYKFLTNNKIVYLGLISYSLYLWHWGILSISYLTIGGIFAWSLPIQLILVFYIAHLSYKYVETPFRNIVNVQKIKTIFIGISSLFISCLSIFLIIIPHGEKFFTGKFKQEDFISVIENKPEEFLDLNNKREDFSSKVIFYFGDSHIFNTLPSLYKVHKKFDFDRIFIRDSSDIRDVLPKDLLIFTSRSYKNDPETKEAIIRDLSNYVIKNNSKLILLDDLTPFGDRPVIDFYSKVNFHRDGPVISKVKAEKLRQNHTKMLKKYVDNKNIYYLDPLNDYCLENYCSAVRNSKLIFSDPSPHINKNGLNIFEDFWKNNLPNILNN